MPGKKKNADVSRKRNMGRQISAIRARTVNRAQF